MKVTSAEFVKSAFESRHWTTDGLPEIAFLGRSNVGKSSLLNSLLMRKGLARTSNTPGRTQSINFFLVNESFYFVDLPGYGYAKVSKEMRKGWGTMAEEYLTDRKELVLSIQLVDSRRDPSDQDRDLNDWLVLNKKKHLVAATKADKLSNNQLLKQIRSISSFMPHGMILPFSATTGKGRDAIWNEISAALKNPRFQG